MIPGKPDKISPVFPNKWTGLWKDASDRVMFIEYIGNLVVASFAGGIFHPFHVDGSMPNGIAKQVPAEFVLDENGDHFLYIRTEEGSGYRLHFLIGEGDRLRLATDEDPVMGILVMPSLTEGRDGGQAFAWAEPLQTYYKAENEEAHDFLISHQ